jgi:flavorubredoxin
MSSILCMNLDYGRPFKLAEEVYWVGFYDPVSGSHANPYLIVDGGEALVIDGGSRSDFPSVMMKIMQTGIAPSSIIGLIYQNYDPRLCGSIPHLEGIIDRKDLKIVTDQANHMFIRHYTETATLLSLQDVNYTFEFSSGRCLQFIKTPYAHSAGSYVTFDQKSGILFTSDLFSSYASKWSLLLSLGAECKKCNHFDLSNCIDKKSYCPIRDILSFHQNIMSSERALKIALEQIAKVPFTIIAPQYGSIIHEAEDIIFVCDLLASLKGVGIDGIIGNRSFLELGDTSCIKERFESK